MSVRVLAFFDARYQSSADVRRLYGEGDAWRRVREARPASRQHFALNLPSTLGQYDLAQPEAAGRVVAMARQVGIDGFVLDCRWDGEAYVTGAQALAPMCGDSFALAFQWRNGEEDFWKAPASRSDRTERASRLISALKVGLPILADGRLLMIVDRPKELADPGEVLGILKEEACRAGLPGLYVIANRSEDKGRFLSNGYDALVDPGPAEWHSCSPSNRPNGLTFLEVMAGLRDSVDYLDRFFPYVLFAVARMINRSQRGKVMPRVFPAYYDWALHPDGGATHLAVQGKPFDSYIYGLFVENAMLFSQQNFAPDERFVFLESWNDWLTGSQVEPSLLDGDMIYNATKSAIDRGRYVIQTRNEESAGGIDEAMKTRIALLVEAAQTLSAASGKTGG
ncbi:glycoside hydrolase family 99-like domain-containing protein [Telmatospirillum siberiense]|uniref:Uncharacterized protein n=1 Tax=Telmatospirillum siberiense TaxID=382514 RepID=A0A2N3PZZ6_9PROT|nr:glycoside hydrolase family 99-like domain-containing protein [Telmatospirillum siberiense]PKU25973.1 hypothetical protein CWS72_02185 [Telmatospirillum siberiense]